MPPEGRAAQEESFRAHIAIAKRHGKALVIHDRDSHDDVVRVLLSEGAPGAGRLPLLLRRAPSWPAPAPSTAGR